MTEHRTEIQTFSGPHTHTHTQTHRTAYKDTYADTDVNTHRLTDNRLVNCCCSARLRSSNPYSTGVCVCACVCERERV